MNNQKKGIVENDPPPTTRRLLALLLTLLLSAGCSSGGGDLAAAFNPGGGGVPAGDGTLTFLFVQAKAVEVPPGTTQVQFEYLDGAQAVLDTEVHPFAPAITVTPPAGTVKVRLTALTSDGFPLSQVVVDVPFPGPGQDIEVDATGFPTEGITLDVFSVTPATVHLAGGAEPGGTQQLTLMATFSNGETVTFSAAALQKAEYTSSSHAVATVSPSGLIAAVGSGTAVVTVKFTDASGQVHTDTVEVNVDCSLGEDAATGVWVKVANNTDTPPNNPMVNYFSFNQPSVNADGRVVFRGRARGATGEVEAAQPGGQPLTGVWFRDLCTSSNVGLVTLADRLTQVPAPNGNGVDFTEFPSIPRIDFHTGLMATRGNHQPVETIPLPGGDTTMAGTTGLYLFDGMLRTGFNNLGNFAPFSIFQVPDVTPLTKFDVFPGSPSVSDGKFLVSKGNFVLDGVGRTCVFFRDITGQDNPGVMIASSLTLIPGQADVTFGSTAPPSAADGKMVFTGLDVEEAPTLGGIYLAPLTPQPALTPLVEIGDLVPDGQGQPLGDGSTFNAFGEGLSFDGRHLAFWAAWGDEKRELILDCPADGNAALLEYCMENAPLPNGQWPVEVPVNQGVFLLDTQTGSLKMVARAGAEQEFEDFLFWVFSGRPPGVGGGEEGDEAEPPRWRASAFVAVDGARGVLFKGSKTPGEGVPESGIYKVALNNDTLGPVQKVVEVGDSHVSIDPSAPAGSVVSVVGLEREAIRDGWFALTLGFLGPELESWAGVYATFAPDFSTIPTSSPPAP